MSDPFIGEIQMFGFQFNPKGWALCNGAVLPIAQNTALFSLLGVTYGGNGQTTFQLPNFVGRAGCEQGQGPGLSGRLLGETFGISTTSLTGAQMPSHNHVINGFLPADAAQRSGTPVAGGGLSQPGSTVNKPFASGAPDTTFAPNMLAPNAGNVPHNNQQPYLSLNFCIALQGTFPSFP